MTCYNRRNKTIRCLTELFKQDSLGKTFTLDVYLLDDSSTDGTSTSVHNIFPQVIIIQGNGNLYWNRGMHLAWKTASAKDYDFYLWLNDDTYLYNYALEQMLWCASKTSSKGIICGCTESPAKKGELSYGGGRLQGKRYVPNYPDGKVGVCDLINGNCVLIPRFVFSVVGNLDWKFIHAIGDNDYSLRAKKKGISSYTTPDFVGLCEHHEALPKWCLKNIGFTERVRNLYSPLGYSHPIYYFIYEKRHFGLLTAIKHYFSIHLRVLIPALWK